MTQEQFNALMARLDRIEHNQVDADEIVVKVMDQVAGLVLPIQIVVDELLDALLAAEETADLDD